MELFIPGLILVAFMIYVSTKIKKSAAAAYEAEQIKNEKFSILKPTGFVHVLNGKDDVAFQAYTKDFGTDEAAEFRLASAEVKIIEGSAIDSVSNDIRSGLSEIKADEIRRIGERSYRVICGMRTEKGIEIEACYKIAESHSSVFVLEISALPDYSREFKTRIEDFLDSLEVS